LKLTPWPPLSNSNYLGYLQISKALFGAFSYFRNASDAEFLEICGAMLSNVIIADLQKMHFAPNGFFSETS